MTARRPPIVAAYAATAALSLVLVMAGMGLAPAELGEPLHYDGGDTLLILPMVQAMAESGTPWVHPRLGAPGVSELYDFPVVDWWHFLWLKVLMHAGLGLVAAFNAYYLLGYPLCSCAALWGFRRLGVSWPAALALAQLYAFLPYHYTRGVGHYFLSAYYLTPLVAVAALELMNGRYPFVGAPGVRHFWSLGTARGVWTVTLGVVLGLSGAYYAFHACAALGFAAVYAALHFRSARPLVAGAGMAGVVALTGVAAHAPAIRYQMEMGRNPEPTLRLGFEADIYGLKIAHLVLPVPDHRLAALQRVRAGYGVEGRPSESENTDATLGAVGALGLVAAFASLILPRIPALGGVPRDWAALLAYLVLFATVGGLGSVFNHLVTPQVRAHCRVCVLIAFVCLAVAGRLFDLRVPGRWKWPAALALLVVGILDQTPNFWFTPRAALGRDEMRADFRGDAAFFGDLESRFPGSMVCCVPHVRYPESHEGEMMSYDHAAGVVHTRTLRFSFGAVSGRRFDTWGRSLAPKPAERSVAEMAALGFDLILVDRRGFAPEVADALHAKLEETLGRDALVAAHPDGERFVWSLARYAAARPAELAALRARLDSALRLEWLAGFSSPRGAGHEDERRVAGRAAELIVENPTNEVKSVEVEVAARSPQGPTTLRIVGAPVWSADVPLGKEPVALRAAWRVPPGRHRVRFACPRPADWLPADARGTVFELRDFRVSEKPG